MSDSTLHNTQIFLVAYMRYKHDTKLVAGWLAKTVHLLRRKTSEVDDVASMTKTKAKRSSKVRKNSSNDKKANKGDGGRK
jgi:hypothetical protein